MPSVAQLERAIHADPGDPFLYYALAQELAKGGTGAPGSLGKAVEAYDRCLTLDPAYCYAYFHKAKVLEAMGRIDDAKSTLMLGVSQARHAADGKALGELSGYLDSLG